MLVTIQTLNNIIVYKLFYACCKKLSDLYRYHRISNLENQFNQESRENTTQINNSIIIIIKIYIRLSKFLEKTLFPTKYDLKKRTYREFQALDWGNNKEIKEIMTAAEDNNNVKVF